MWVELQVGWRARYHINRLLSASLSRQSVVRRPPSQSHNCANIHCLLWAAGGGEQTADSRLQTADSRQQAADSRQQERLLPDVRGGAGGRAGRCRPPAVSALQSGCCAKLQVSNTLNFSLSTLAALRSPPGLLWHFDLPLNGKKMFLTQHCIGGLLSVLFKLFRFSRNCVKLLHCSIEIKIYSLKYWWAVITVIRSVDKDYRTE